MSSTFIWFLNHLKLVNNMLYETSIDWRSDNLLKVQFREPELYYRIDANKCWIVLRYRNMIAFSIISWYWYGKGILMEDRGYNCINVVAPEYACLTTRRVKAGLHSEIHQNTPILVSSSISDSVMVTLTSEPISKISYKPQYIYSKYCISY